MAETEKNRDALQEKVDEFANELSSARDVIKELKSELAEQTEVRERLENELIQMTSDVSALEGQLEETAGRLTQREEELAQRKDDLRRYAESRQKLAENLETVGKQNKALREMVAKSQKEALGLREYIEKLQALSKDRLEKAKHALEKRDDQLRKQLASLQEQQRENERLQRRLERSELLEAALKGALTDLRSQIMTKDEMVEELEWHLGLVYQTLEDGQLDLDGKEEELTRLKDESDDKIRSLEKKLKKRRRELDKMAKERDELEDQLSSLKDSMETQQAELERATLRWERTTVRLDRVLSDLSEEQERSARLGAQLTDALEDRNRRVQRLRELQREFSEWRESSSGEEATRDKAVIEELNEELNAAQTRELDLQRALTELQDALAKNVREKAQKEQELDQLHDSAERSPTPSASAGAHEDLVIEVSTGVHLGTQVLTAQMDLLKLKTKHEELHEKMNSVEDNETLTTLVAELKSCEEEREQQEELVEVLEGEWADFKEAASDDGRELLSTLIGIVEVEMKQAREAEIHLEKVRQQLELLTSGALSAEDVVADGLKAQLQEKITLVSELEEELVQVSAQLNETNEKLLELEGAQGDGADFLSWKEITSLRDELKQKTELLENYRAERKQGQSSDSSLEEEIANLNTRYQKGRRRITQLLSELEEKNRLLAELTGSAEEIPPPPPVTADEFELPPPIEDEFPDLDDLPVPEGLGDLSSALLKEETVEDLPAIPYPEEVSELDELESALSSDPDGSLTEDQDS